ncbi:ecto-ADP-ribosyltransferase 4 [Sorex fumeus]|uniref:ecto-ADP-ribosyltransferase 4 n=1 Tax=Sorex fumeus TaxID=62283 RepID=UPI0024AE39E8|nr:ecto-ADP-ribosyltransferase 4 [Sorex fumeus]
MRRWEQSVRAHAYSPLAEGGSLCPRPRTPLLPLLLLLSSLQEPTVAATSVIDLTPGSFDDQYQGCSQQTMEMLNEGDYFTKEVEANRNYSKIWQNAHLNWLNQEKSLPPNMTITHAVAILVYTLNSNIRSEFTRVMASTGQSAAQYSHAFHFKYLHYYLTSAIQLLRKQMLRNNDSHCYKVRHEATNVSLEASIGDTLRFGQFLSASLLREDTPKLGNKTLFSISTCLGIPVEYFTLKKEVLVPPYELFEVVNVTSLPKGNWVQLHSTGNFSTYNCQLLKASGRKHLPVPVIVASLSLLTSALISSKSGI